MYMIAKDQKRPIPSLDQTALQKLPNWNVQLTATDTTYYSKAF